MGAATLLHASSPAHASAAPCLQRAVALAVLQAPSQGWCMASGALRAALLRVAGRARQQQASFTQHTSSNVRLWLQSHGACPVHAEAGSACVAMHSDGRCCAFQHAEG